MIWEAIKVQAKITAERPSYSMTKNIHIRIGRKCRKTLNPISTAIKITCIVAYEKISLLKNGLACDKLR